MVSIDSVSRISDRTMPFRALLKHDLDSLFASWLVRLWLGACLLLTLLILASNWPSLPTAYFIASILLPYLVFPWFLVAIVLGISPMTGARAEALADGILCRPVTRIEYLVAAWAARVFVVLSVYLLGTVPAVVLIAFAKRPAPVDAVTLYGIVASLFLVGLVLTFLVTFGFLLGTVLQRSTLAIVVMVFVWLPINFVLTTFSLEEFSPISLNQALPTLLRTPWRPPDEQAEGQTEGLTTEQAQIWGDSVGVVGGWIPGATPAPPREQEPEFYDQKKYEDFSLVRVVLGYGIPTILAMVLATLFFCRRDF